MALSPTTNFYATRTIPVPLISTTKNFAIGSYRHASRIDLVAGLRHDGRAGIRVIPARKQKRLPGCKNPPIKDGIALFILLDYAFCFRYLHALNRS